MISKGKAILGVVALLAAAVGLEVGTYDRAAAAADFEAVKAGMAKHYANLDTIVAKRHLDLPRLDRETQAAIADSRSRVQLYFAMRSFTSAFGDPHLQVKRGRLPVVSVDAAAQPDHAPASCKEAGYSDGGPRFDRRIFALPNFRPLAEIPFPAGISGKTGVIRIASFDEHQYPAECEWAFRAGASDRAIQLATRKELQKRLVETINRVRKAGANRLVIDLTGNGGGSEWDREAAALFTTGVMRRTESRRADARCDRSVVWTGSKPPCAVFAPGSEIATVVGRGVWRGPVTILADGGTASAAEEFIGWLVDNDRATLVGTRTMGAGCGYIDGGNPVVLKAAPLTVMMPNCARFTAGGVNEIEGWTPAHELPFPSRSDEADWGKKLLGLIGG